MQISGATLIGTRVVDASIVTSNLLIWLDASNTASYPGSGTLITDLSGNGWTHQMYNATFTTIGGVKCWNCTAANQVLQPNIAGNQGPTLPTTGFSYTIWGNIMSANSVYRTLLRSYPNDHAMLAQPTTDLWGMWDNTAGNFFGPTPSYTITALANTWVQYSVVGDSTGQWFYINDRYIGTVSGYSAAGNNHCGLGNIYNGGSQPFGLIANCMMYSTKLSLEQIQQNYQAYKRALGV